MRLLIVIPHYGIQIVDTGLASRLMAVRSKAWRCKRLVGDRATDGRERETKAVSSVQSCFVSKQTVYRTEDNFGSSMHSPLD
jgi:hypothetical protein